MDLVTFGEGLIRLTPVGHTLVSHVGGAELNVAVAAARLGVASRWITRLPDNAAGRFIEGIARMHGVDTRVDWAADGRVGLYFLDQGAAPRQSSVVYDRKGSAFTTIPPGTLDWTSLFGKARWLHVSGITPALGDAAAEVTAEALQAARAAGLTTSYDVNYRMKLWDAARARAVQEPLLRYVDLLVVSQDDARLVFGAGADTPETVARSLRGELGTGAVAVTVRDSADGIGAVVVSEDGAFAGARCDVDVVERVGTGDAFTAGLIAGRLEGRGWDDAVRFATAMAALKLTMPGDFFLGERSHVEALLERSHGKAVR